MQNANNANNANVENGRFSNGLSDAQAERFMLILLVDKPPRLVCSCPYGRNVVFRRPYQNFSVFF